VEQHFDRAKLKEDDDEATFPPTEPLSFSSRKTSPGASPEGHERPSADSVETAFWTNPPKTIVSGFPSLAPPPRPTPSPKRSAFAKVLFATLFGGIALLLGYALMHHGV
jgi:hypothetical protein